MDDFEFQNQERQQAERKKDQKAQVNFRAPEEMAAWIKDQSKEKNQKQEDFLCEMVEEYMLKLKEEAFPSRGVEVADFKSHLLALNRMFVASLDLCENTENRVREEFVLQLKTKDQAIADYQEQVTALKEANKNLVEDAEKAKELQAELDKVTEQARKDRNEAADRIAEKDRLISTLDGRLEMLEIQAAGYDDLKAERDALERQLQEDQITIKDQTKDHQMEMERAAMAARKAQDEAVAAAKAEADSKITDLKEQLQEAKIAGAKDLQAAEKAAHETDKAASAEIRKLEQENARLREQLAQLRVSLPMKDEEEKE